MTKFPEGMTDLKNDYSKIKIGSCKTMMATKRGIYEEMLVTKNNKNTMIQKKNVRYVQEMFCKIK